MSGESPQNPAAHSPTLATPDGGEEGKNFSFFHIAAGGALVLSRRAPRA